MTECQISIIHQSSSTVGNGKCMKQLSFDEVPNIRKLSSSKKPSNDLNPNSSLPASNSIQKSPSNQSVVSQQYSNILKTVGKKIRKTKAELDRSGWIHPFYILSLVIYSVVGGGVFLALDGPASDMAIDSYDRRCVDMRERMWRALTVNCLNLTFVECENETRRTLLTVDKCLRSIDRNVTVYPTSHYLNSLIYAITVYTTIGYGTISMSSRSGRAATIIYTLIGTPLFFAFLNDMGQWFQRLFLLVYRRLRRLLKMTKLYTMYADRRVSATGVDTTISYDDGPSRPGLIFTCSVIFLVLYFLVISTMFCLIEQWSFFDSFYFVFQSIALIGFGDVFPNHPNTVLFTIIFIIVGISLLSMCFFILQEWIREKTSRLSKRFRYSVRHWRETHHFPTHYLGHAYWSARNISRRASTVPEPRVSFFSTPSSLNASREHLPSTPETPPLGTLNGSVKRKTSKTRRSSFGKSVVGGKFQFVTDIETYSDISE